MDVILPCLDEAAALPWVLSRFPPGYRAIVADNGSTDDSVRIAHDHGATVVPARPRGFGAAAHAGVLAATADIVCFMDADGSLDPRDLPAVAEPVLAGHADLVLVLAKAPRPGRVKTRLCPPGAAAGRRTSLDVLDRTGAAVPRSMHRSGPVPWCPATSRCSLGARARRWMSAVAPGGSWRPCTAPAEPYSA
ncbi:MAG: glycosyltransferase [Micromonosporaceae bacterium]|nr:glycosyltransferase [Micromonosporaceae bacterium]